jgi:hypothetical protein
MTWTLMAVARRMSDAERVDALKPYLRHHGGCAFIARGEECDCGLYRLLGFKVGKEKREHGNDEA